MFDHISIEDSIRKIISFIGEDPNREGLRETPSRVVRAYYEMTSGYREKPEDVMKTFTDGVTDEMVISKGIEITSLCEHHLLPFYGYAHIGYIPNGKIVGLSKLTRLLEIYSKRLQVQERLTMQVTEALDKHLQPHGSACLIECKHMCQMCRGVKKDSIMITSSLTGVFRTDMATRAEFMNLVKD